MSGDPPTDSTMHIDGVPLPPADENDPLIGVQLGKYRLVARLGAGGMGVVYEAEDVHLLRRVALKVLQPDLACDEAALRRFLREAQASAQLNHPNVIAAYDCGRSGDTVFLVMELVRGGSAHDRLRAAGPFPWREATSIAVAACRGLAAAHAAGLCHRDIKPANLLLGDDGAIKVADFGLVRFVHGRESALTRPGGQLGTPDFMSPEQCRSRPADARSDVYSLGATYYTLLTGRKPFPSTDAMQVMFRHCEGPPPDPRAADPTLPRGCTAVVRRSMATKPTDRYAGADEMCQELEALLAAPADRPRWRPGRRTLLLGAAAAAVVACVPAAWWLLGPRRSGKGDSPPADLEGPIRLAPGRILEGHRGEVRCVRFFDGGRQLLSCGDDSTVRHWRVEDGLPGAILHGAKKVHTAAVSPDNRTIVTGGEEGILRFWEAETGEERAHGREPTSGTVYGLEFAPNGGHLAAANGYGGVQVWQVDGGGRLQPAFHHPVDGQMVTGLRFSPDGRRLAVVQFQKAVLVWKVGAWQEAPVVRNLAAAGAAFSPDGESLYMAAADGLHRWTPGSDPSRLAVATGLRDVALSPAGGLVAFVGMWGGTLTLLRPATGERHEQTTGRDHSVRSVAFSPDGRHLATGDSAGGRVQLWRIETEP